MPASEPIDLPNFALALEEKALKAVHADQRDGPDLDHRYLTCPNQLINLGPAYPTDAAGLRNPNGNRLKQLTRGSPPSSGPPV